MKILDKYLLKHFLPTYLFAGIMFCFFYCLVNLLSNLNQFLDKGAGIIDVAKYYAFFLPSLWMQLSPLTVLIGVWFSIGHLAQDREIMAMRLSGISALRITMPLLISGLIISSFCLGININLVPFCEEKKEETWKGRIQGEEEYLNKSKENFQFASQDIVYFTKNFSGKESEMNEIKSVYNEIGNGNSVIITAKKALWKKDKWVLIDGVKKIFDKDGNVKEIEVFDSKESALSLSAHELWLYSKSPSIMPMKTIKKYILEYKTSLSRYPYLTQFHSRFSLPFINFTLLVISIPFCLLSLHQNAAGRMSWALGLCLIYYVLFSLLVAMSEKGTIPPAMGIWFPNILFLGIGMFYIWKKR
ncbi:MAG: LptF/LptG family permease [Candidatus Omnitrophica bacterium]|nr:LptF/LptG family permease [Candidatus Omnitrophota bacterium]MBU1047201.1 LptF/LptG family permease [Candidatus Omnitrophota bacterium]MBU1630236.1 LptF/LptG family permease [Candidatus Omnitrophota bacterium]MBU1766792.1 LptF/LptG family permease [Candidatus Omnitrophota bacterium]MBU1889501.1 LptF/LptG family permease [Candidatus Omnitrophota bacterium]